MRAPDSKTFMKINSVTSESGSVLVTALITITILTLICATTLYVASQNTGAGMQTASWQQALSGAESAVDQAFNALNQSALPSPSPSPWAGWKSVKCSSPLPTLPTLPTTQPTPSGSPFPSATAPPAPGYLNYYVSQTPLNFSTGTEGNNSVSFWVTIDTTAPSPAPSPAPLKDNNGSGNQWYRVRATGVANGPAMVRVSNNRLDDDLRNTFGLRFNRKTGTTITGTGTNLSQVTRTIEVIAAKQSILTYGIFLRKSINMQGSNKMVIDSFNSNNGPYSSISARNHGNVATTDSTNSNLNGQTLNGSLAYSGPPIQGTGGVTGMISTPFNGSAPDTSDPVWSAPPNPPSSSNPNGTLSGAPSGVLYAGSASSPSSSPSPTHVKINGAFTLNGGALIIANGNPPGANGIVPDAYIEIWVSGAFSTSSILTQNSGVHVTWYVDGNLTTGGNSYVNNTGTAKDTTFIGVGTGTATISGTSDFVAAVNAPGYNMTVQGSGSLFGSFVGNTLNMQGSGNIHYDEALNPPLVGTGNTYVVASWFEDNADPTRKALAQDGLYYPIIY